MCSIQYQKYRPEDGNPRPALTKKQVSHKIQCWLITSATMCIQHHTITPRSLVIIGSSNGLSPVRHQAIALCLSLRFVGAKLCNIWIRIQNFFPEKMYLIMSFAKLRLFHSGIDQCMNASPPSAAYMRRWTGSALVQIMACRLDGAKPLSEPMLTYYQFDHRETYFNEILFEIQIFSFSKMRLNMSSTKWRSFCLC